MELIQTKNTAVSVIESSLEIFKNGGQIILSTTARADKAISIGDRIIADIETNGGKLNPELDTRCLNYLANCASAKKDMNEGRKPITQMMDEVKSRFIEQENRVDNKKAGSRAFLIQQYRDAYVLQLQQEEDQRHRDAELKAAKDHEAINLKAEHERRLQAYFSNYLLLQKQGLQASFNAITLDKWDEQEATFSAQAFSYPYSHYSAFDVALVSRYNTSEELTAVIGRPTSERHSALSATYQSEMQEAANKLIQYLPSRKKELERVAKANEEERQRIYNEQAKRDEDAKAQMERDAEEAKRKAESVIAQEQQAAKTEMLFNKEVSLATDQAPKPETRHGYLIEIVDPKGWPIIFQFWYEREGMKLPLDKAGKTSLNSMVTFCEGYAKKYNEQIESPYIKYSTSIKAVNRK